MRLSCSDWMLRCGLVASALVSSTRATNGMAEDSQSWKVDAGRAGNRQGRLGQQRWLVGLTIGSETSARSRLSHAAGDGSEARTVGSKDWRDALWEHGQARSDCRSVEDCALGARRDYGPDGKTTARFPRAFNGRDMSPKKLRIGYVKSAFDMR